jgi:hypothetical protein
MGNRPSSLPVAQFCGLAPRLSEEAGAGRAAAISTYFHALCEGDAKRIKAARLLLTDEEAEEAEERKRPVDVVIVTSDGGSVPLRYADARKERRVGLGPDLRWRPPGHPEAITEGTLDFAWVHGTVAYVADIKATAWTCEGPDSLQLKAYAYAFATQERCTHFVPGLWLATEGRWWWGDQVELDSLDNLDDEARLLHAINNQDQRPAPGGHCRSCWGRMRCPAHTLSAVHADTWLAPVVEGRSHLTTPEQARKLLLVVQATEDTLKMAKDQLQEYARRNGGIPDPETGKVYAPVMMPGRASVDAKALRAALGDEADKYMKTGAGYEQYRWIKARNP